MNGRGLHLQSSPIEIAGIDALTQNSLHHDDLALEPSPG